MARGAGKMLFPVLGQLRGRAPDRFMNASEVAARVKETNPSWVVDVVEAFGEVTVQVPRDSIDAVCSFLRDNAGFDMLADLCGADNGPEEDPRFVVNYHLLGTGHKGRIRLQVLLSEDDPHVST